MNAPIRIAVAAITLNLVTACGPTPGPKHGTSPASNWWMFQADLAHTGELPGTLMKLPLTKKWERVLFTGITSLTSPVFGDGGRIYIGSGDGKLHALSDATGATLWTFTAPNEGIVATPAAASGKVYVATLGATTSTVFALAAGTGSIVWQRSIGRGSRAGLAVANGKVFVNTDLHQVIAFDEQTGAIAWTAQTSNGTLSQESSVAVGFGDVLVGSDDGLYALNISTGAQHWKFPLTDLAGFSSPVVHANAGVGNPALVFISTNDKKLHAVRASDGTPVWSFTGNTTLAFATVALSQGKVVLLNFRNVTALDANTGAVLWDVPLGTIPRFAPAITNGVVYVTADDGVIRGLDLNNGNQVWTGAAPGNADPSAPSNALAIDRGLLIAPRKGHVYAFAAPASGPMQLCTINPGKCFDVGMIPGGIILRCETTPDCINRDPIPKNCLVKWECPGCGPGGLCPPWYRIALDGLGAAWTVDLADPRGERYPHEVIPTRSGVIIAFRPATEDFKPGSIGDYTLVFQMTPQGQAGKRYDIKTRLTLASGPSERP